MGTSPYRLENAILAIFQLVNGESDRVSLYWENGPMEARLKAKAWNFVVSHGLNPKLDSPPPNLPLIVLFKEDPGALRVYIRAAEG